MSPETRTNNGHAQAPLAGRIPTDHAPQTGRVLAIVAAGLMAVLVVGFAVAFAVRHHRRADADAAADVAKSSVTSVDVVPVRATASRYPLSLPGQTAGFYQSTIYARVDGYVGTWSADIGDRVRQGQVLAVIDTPELDQQLVAADAKADASDAMVDVAQSNESIARLTYDRWRDSPKGVVSEQEREQKQADYAAARARLAQARAQAKLDRADATRYSATKSFQHVTAPYDGIITARKLDVGDLVTAGSSANTSPLYSLAQSNLIRVFVDVPQNAAADTVVGTPAAVTADPFPGRPFPGKVARSAMSIDPQTRTERVEVDVANADLALIPGMYVQVTFELAQRGLLQVPAAAMLARPGGMQVAVVGPDGTVEFRPVTVAKDDGDTVELSDGVRPGDRVALNISSAVAPGEHVDAVEEPGDDHPAVQPPAPVQRSAPPATARSPADHPPASESGTHPPAPAIPPRPVPGHIATSNRPTNGTGGE